MTSEDKSLLGGREGSESIGGQMGGCDSKQREDLVDVEDDDFYKEVRPAPASKPVHTRPGALRDPPSLTQGLSFAAVQNYAEDGTPRKSLSKASRGVGEPARVCHGSPDIR